jgi:hypothetical protein
VKNNTTEMNVTVKTSDGSTGWKPYSITGTLIASDGALAIYGVRLDFINQWVEKIGGSIGADFDY